MNIHTRKLESEISESEVNEALSVLKKWRDQGGEIDLSNENIHPSEVTNLWVDYPKLNDNIQLNLTLTLIIRLHFLICKMALAP